MTRLTLNEAILEGLIEEMVRDPSVYVIGQDIGPFGGPMQSAAGLWDRFGSTGRVIDAPISEAAMIGTSVGAAMTGMRPVVDMMFAEFLSLATVPLALESGSIFFRSGGRLKVPLVVRAKYGVGPHHGHPETLYGALGNFPGLKVVVPSAPRDAKGLIIAAIRDDNPVVFLEHMSLLHGPKEEVPDGEYETPLGAALVCRAGNDATLVASGLMVSRALRAAEELTNEGIDVEVIDLRTLAPLDSSTIIGSVSKTHRLVVVDEAWPYGGVAAEVVAIVAGSGRVQLLAPAKRVQPPPLPVPFSLSLEKAYVPAVAKISAALRHVTTGVTGAELTGGALASAHSGASASEED